MCKDFAGLNDLVIIPVEHGPVRREMVGECPDCSGIRFVKNGKTGSGRQNYRCKQCGRQSELNPDTQPVRRELRRIIENLLNENVKVGVIQRAVGLTRGQIYTIKRKMKVH